MLIDSATIHVRSGKGGDGCVSFRREKYIPKGGPDGGDGGDGGSVIFQADPAVDTLLDFAGRHHWHAENGQPGGPKQCFGRNGADLLVRVPVGTLVHDSQTDELLADMAEPGKRVVIAPGGRGGLGNEHFKSATNQAPRQATPGQPAVERLVRLELKLIADVGLLGKPNAGKSTLLSRISRATPKVADYPFTTLEPQLGIAELPGMRRVVVADIPGLIEGAHEGQGLGTRFLRHVERTRVLVHLLEVQPTDGSDPVENYRMLRREMAAFSPALAEKTEIVALSKMDLVVDQAERQAMLQELERRLGTKIQPISAATGEGLGDLLQACWNALQDEQPDDRERGWPGRAENT